MSGPLRCLARKADSLTRGFDADQLLDILTFLQELEEAECYNPQFLSEVRQKASDEREAENIRYEQKAARAYLDGGKLDTASSAYFYLYFRESMKFLGNERAARMGGFALDMARDEGRTGAVDALTEAIAALRDEPGTKAVQDDAEGMANTFRCNLNGSLNNALTRSA